MIRNKVSIVVNLSKFMFVGCVFVVEKDNEFFFRGRIRFIEEDDF